MGNSREAKDDELGLSVVESGHGWEVKGWWWWEWAFSGRRVLLKIGEECEDCGERSFQEDG